MNECLYRWFNKDGELLYIGISSGIGGRTKGHQRSSDWANKASFITLEWYESRHQVEREERLAIVRERPLHNKVFNCNGAEPRHHPPIATWQEAAILKQRLSFYEELWERQKLIGDDNERYFKILMKRFHRRAA